jgi:hypothetical protein
MEIQGYVKLSYADFRKILFRQFAELNIPNRKLASMINVKSEMTAKNVFREYQVVSDEVLTLAMKALKIDGFVMWCNGKKFYYVSSES